MINLSFFRRHPSDTTSEKDDPGDGEETRSSYPVLAGIVAALREAGRRSVARKPLAVTTQAFARFRPFRVVRVRVVRDGGRGFLPAGSEKTCKQTLFCNRSLPLVQVSVGSGSPRAWALSSRVR